MLQFTGSQRVGHDLVTEQQQALHLYSPLPILILHDNMSRTGLQRLNSLNRNVGLDSELETFWWVGKLGEEKGGGWGMLSLGLLWQFSG